MPVMKTSLLHEALKKTALWIRSNLKHMNYKIKKGEKKHRTESNESPL